MTPENAEGPVQRVHTVDDLRRYSANVPDAQEDLLLMVRSARGRAVRNAQLAPGEAFVQNHGDGELVRWADTVHGLALLNRYVPALAVELGKANARLTEEARAQMRMAMTEGYSRRVGDGLVGAAPITVQRLLDSWQCRRALELLPHRPLVVVIDSRLHSLVEQRLDSLDPRDFIPIQVELPEKRFSEAAWLTVPGCDTAELELLRKELAAGRQAGEADQSRPPGPGRTADRPRRPERPLESGGDDHAVRTGEAGDGEDDDADGRRWRPSQASAIIIGAAIAALASIAVAFVPFLPWNQEQHDSDEPAVDITGTCTAAGDQLKVASGGFTPGKSYTVTVTDPAGQAYDLSSGSSGIATEEGTLRTGWTCETKDTPGTYTIAVTDTSTGRTARDTFQVDKVG